ncbi:unnamed protein product [Lactuca virosa]|uniref:Clathrin light chain n=1 Tax=Lactuca virosa TaxID=75947 RepID=A0AAU9MG72_9ASTR|nr:unnamed protein product [Lactuca virosa]
MEMHRQNQIKREEETEAEIANMKKYYYSEEEMEAEKAKWRQIYYSTLKEKKKAVNEEEEESLEESEMESEPMMEPQLPSSMMPAPPPPSPPLTQPPLEFKLSKEGAVLDTGGSNKLVTKSEVPLINDHKQPLTPPPYPSSSPSPSPPPSWTVGDASS